MFKRRILLFILLCIAVMSSASFFLLLHYYDPYINIPLALSFLAVSFILSVSSTLALILYFIKKIHYRGDVGVYHVRTSVRQGIFVSLMLISIEILFFFHIPLFPSSLLVVFLFILLEFFIQGM